MLDDLTRHERREIVAGRMDIFDGAFPSLCDWLGVPVPSM